MTAIVRVKNEARALPWTLPPLLRAVDRVVLIDNGSTDGTPAVAREIGGRGGRGGPLDVARYPFAVARCGAEHLATPETSVHSLAYFYNWSFAHVRTSYALKWDGDMVLVRRRCRSAARPRVAARGGRAVVRVPRLGSTSRATASRYVDTELRNCEPWAWPNRPGYRFVKALEWELPMLPAGLATVTLPEFSCVELKFLDGDEFGHWSPTDFDASPRTARKRREQAVFGALAARRRAADGRRGRPRARRATHVIDHVRDVWLPQQAAAGRAGAARAAAPAGAASSRPDRRHARVAREVAQLVGVAPQVVELGRAADVLDVLVAGACAGRVKRGMPFVRRAGGPSSRISRPRPAAGGRASGSSERPSSAHAGLRARQRRGSSARGRRSRRAARRRTPRGSPGPRISSGTRIDGS